MTDGTPQEQERFLEISREYAQALEAYQAIEKQAATLMALGATTQLESFIGDFMRMATEAREHAREADMQNFTDWFDEMISQMRKLRVQLAEGESDESD